MASYLILGHVTQDLTPGGPIAGGTASYASHMARSLGYRTRLVTSAAGELSLYGVEVDVIPAKHTTTFEYEWIGGARVQRLTKRAAGIKPAAIPQPWRESAIWHLAPVAAEIEPLVVDLMPKDSFLGVTPQGWLRSVGSDDVVERSKWVDAAAVIRRADAIVLSCEDADDAHEQAREWSLRGPVVVVTESAQGSVVYEGGSGSRVEAFRMAVMDELGAVDVFAVALFHRMKMGDNPIAAAQFSSAAAAISVSRRGPANPPGLSEIEALLAQRPRL